MGRIREIVDAAFVADVLSVSAEVELQQLLPQASTLDDLMALVILQQATRSGRIQRESDQVESLQGQA
jgi:hypothetical protein